MVVMVREKRHVVPCVLTLEEEAVAVEAAATPPLRVALGGWHWPVSAFPVLAAACSRFEQPELAF